MSPAPLPPGFIPHPLNLSPQSHWLVSAQTSSPPLARRAPAGQLSSDSDRRRRVWAARNLDRRSVWERRWATIPDNRSDTVHGPRAGDSYRPQRQDVASLLFDNTLKQASISNIDSLTLMDVCLMTVFIWVFCGRVHIFIALHQNAGGFFICVKLSHLVWKKNDLNVGKSRGVCLLLSGLLQYNGWIQMKWD